VNEVNIKQFDFVFSGADYKKKRDYNRLKGQILNVYNLMRDGRWRSVQEISAEIHAPENSVSAQLRNLRKEANGGFNVERRRRNDSNLSEYRLVL
jgi:hypothetical protein